jgi:hypothetical protein
MSSQATQEMQNRAEAKLAGIRDQIAGAAARHQVGPKPAAPPPAATTAAPAVSPPPPAAPSPGPELLTLPPLDPSAAPPVQAPPAPAASPAAGLNGAGLDLPAGEESDPAKLRQRIRTLEGVLDAERNVQGPARERRLQEQIDQLKGELATATKPVPKVTKLEDHFSAEEIEEMGVDFLTKQLRMVDSRVQQAVQEATAPLKQELQQVRDKDREDVQTAETRRNNEYLAALSAAVHGWNEWAMAGPKLDPRFRTWLQVRVYGKERSQLLTEAHTNRDSETVIGMLREFLQSLSKGASAPPLPDGRQFPDSRSAGEDPPPPPNPYDFTLSEVTKFYLDVGKSKYKGRGREMLEMDKRIREARIKGRIGPG